jgi:RNA polymerase sigma factor (sigma-70 family)
MTKNNINLIRKIAWSFHHTTGIEFDELFSEACLAYCESLKKYDNKRGKMTTYAYMYIQNHLKNYLKKNQRQIHVVSFEDIQYDKHINYHQLIDQMSQEAIQISTILTHYSKYFACPSQIDSRKRIIKMMLQRGWSLEKIWIGFNDIRLALS